MNNPMPRAEVPLTRLEAETILSDLIARGASTAKIDAASFAVLDADDAEDRRLKAGDERQKVEHAIARGESHARQERLRAAMDAAEKALVLSDAPVVTVKANGLVVCIRLVGAMDMHKRMVLRRAAALAVEEADRSFVARVGHARAVAGGDDGVVLPTRRFLVDRMLDELRHAEQACPGSMTVELVEPIEHDNGLAATAPSGSPSSGVGRDYERAAASSHSQEVGAAALGPPCPGAVTPDATGAPIHHDNAERAEGER